MSPLTAFELLFFAVFGQTTYEDLTLKGPNNEEIRPQWTANLFKIVFGIYMLVSVVVLINLLIAMMSDTYQRIQLLFFGVFGQTNTANMRYNNDPNEFVFPTNGQPEWTEILFKFIFGIYQLISVVVLINLLIAMMTDTYQRIQAQSDIEWKFGLSKLIRSMHRTTTAPSPINLITTWLCYFIELCRQKMKKRKKPSLTRMMSIQNNQMSASSKTGAKWANKVKKRRSSIAPKDSIAFLSSPLGSQISFVSQFTRIENVADWESIAKKYRALTGETEEIPSNENDEENSDENDENGSNNGNSNNL